MRNNRQVYNRRIWFIMTISLGWGRMHACFMAQVVWSLRDRVHMQVERSRFWNFSDRKTGPFGNLCSRWRTNLSLFCNLNSV